MSDTKRGFFAEALVFASLFFLPFQTRWIYHDLTVGGEVWEYGRLSVYAVELLILVALALRGRPRLSSSLSSFVKPAVLFFGTLLISTSFSQSIPLATASLPHFAAALGLFFLVADERTVLRRAAWAFVAGLVIPCGLAWYQVVTGTSPAYSWLGLATHDAATLGQSVVETATGRILRGYGTLPHPNVFGGYLAVGLILLGWLSRRARTTGAHLLMAAPTVLIASSLIITFSRSAWLGVAVGFGSLAVAALVTRHSVPHQAIPFVSLSLLVVLITLFVFHSAVFTRFSVMGGFSSGTQPAARLEAKSIEERFGSYAAFDDVIFTNVVMGVGPGNYTVALATIFPNMPAWSYQPIHNALLLALAETGLIVLLPAVKFLLALHRLLRETLTTAGGLFAVTLVAALLPIALLDHYLWSLWPGLALSSVAVAFALKFSSGARS